MILKELDPFNGRSQGEIASRISQDRMAYHLRRFFAKSKEVDVLNCLRVRSGGRVTHVEHLVLHPYGLIVIERENLSEMVQIREDGQWVRGHGNQLVEVRSPVIRAYLRALSLKAFLDRIVKQKGFFDGVELDVLVAVSDIDKIQWPAAGRLAEVCNLEQVHEHVMQRIAACRRTASTSGILSASERLRLADFLRYRHQPLSRAASS